MAILVYHGLSATPRVGYSPRFVAYIHDGIVLRAMDPVGTPDSGISNKHEGFQRNKKGFAWSHVQINGDATNIALGNLNERKHFRGRKTYVRLNLFQLIYGGDIHDLQSDP